MGAEITIYRAGDDDVRYFGEDEADCEWYASDTGCEIKAYRAGVDYVLTIETFSDLAEAYAADTDTDTDDALATERAWRDQHGSYLTDVWEDSLAVREWLGRRYDWVCFEEMHPNGQQGTTWYRCSDDDTVSAV